MNCSECFIYIKDSHRICEDICDLLNKLGIPLQEQSILWNLADRNMCCQKFREILSVLIKMKDAA